MPARSDPTTAHLTEIFSSIQGEGPYVGVRQIFLRFYGCHRRCVFCDSPETVTAWQPPGYQPASCRVEWTPGRRDFRALDNPFSLEGLVALLRDFNTRAGPHHSVALTGGEPLLQPEFLSALLPHINQLGMKSYLETAGDLYPQLEHLLPWLDIAAMDIKLPSVTQNEAAWGSHRKFLARCVENEVEIFAKAIVSAETDPADLDAACAVLRETAPNTLLILQPMTPFGDARNAPRPEQLLDWQAQCLAHLPNIRVIPQTHRFINQL
ncbi:MAG: 7-carboxy-7-deazaguanine synthase QueE [Kiritimatiellae bacterium]|nr:7-carboxy-7-deazaguanine synthase QueE [Kiritimatiellia bacterium]